MDTSAITLPADAVGPDQPRLAQARSLVLWGVGALTVLGIALRFPTLGLQSYHHDEIITAARVLPGSFIHMLHEVKAGESNPPLYYVLGWGWSKLFGTGEFGLRSLSALFGAATIPIAFLIGRELVSDRAGLIAAAITAVNPMLIWYSQEARSYALLIFFGAVALLFFARALRTKRASDLALWSVASIAALCTHYFTAFPIAAESAWLLYALRDRWRVVAPAIGAVAAIGLALIPLVLSQINPVHIGWMTRSPLPERIYQTGISFLIGETGRVIAEPPREKFAVIPALLVLAGFVLVALRATIAERRAARLLTVVGLSVVAFSLFAALIGHDYIIERNLLPALVPLGIVAAIGFASPAARRIGLICAVALCAYWVAFDIHVTQTPNLQRPNYRELAEKLGPPRGPRAIVTWKLASDSLLYYLADGAQHFPHGSQSVAEVAIISKKVAAERPVRLPPAFHPVESVRLNRLTLTRFVSRTPHTVWYHKLRALSTGFGRNAIVVDGVPSHGSLASRIGIPGH